MIECFLFNCLVKRGLACSRPGVTEGLIFAKTAIPLVEFEKKRFGLNGEGFGSRGRSRQNQTCLANVCELLNEFSLRPGAAGPEWKLCLIFTPEYLHAPCVSSARNAAVLHARSWTVVRLCREGTS